MSKARGNDGSLGLREGGVYSVVEDPIGQEIAVTGKTLNTPTETGGKPDVSQGTSTPLVFSSWTCFLSDELQLLKRLARPYHVDGGDVG